MLEVSPEELGVGLAGAAVELSAAGTVSDMSTQRTWCP